MNMMRHCRQCRADAVGLLGEDRSAEFSTEKVDAMEVRYDAASRKAYQDQVEQQRNDTVAARHAEQERLDALADTSGIVLQLAVATKGQGRINEHFGHVAEFQIYEVSAQGARFVGHRRVDNYCEGGYGEEDTLATVIRAINDCHAVLVAKIGGCPKDDLRKAGIDPVDKYAHEYIEQSALAYYIDYIAQVRSGAIVHQSRGDASIRQGAYIAAA